MDDTAKRVLHWRPSENLWIEIDWDDFIAFREFFKPFKPLPGIAPGVQCFVVCVCDDVQTWNIIPHKYLVEPNGKIGKDNFYGWNREEREDFKRLMIATEFQPGEEERLSQIRAKGGSAMYPPRESLYPLVHALPYPPRIDSAATAFLDALAAVVTRAELHQAS